MIRCWLRALTIVLLVFSTGVASAFNLQTVSDLENFENVVNATWASNSTYVIMPPGDMAYKHSLGTIAYESGFDTNVLSSLVAVTNNSTGNAFVLYPVEVIESVTSGTSRVRNYYSSVSTNPVSVHSTQVATVNYPESWVENAYGEPPDWLNGTALQTWYDDRDPLRQHLVCSLIATNDVAAYMEMLTNSIGQSSSGTNTISLIAQYSNDIAFVENNLVPPSSIELYLHAPDDVPTFDLFCSTNLQETLGWQLKATLNHNINPVSYLTECFPFSFFHIGNAALDTDNDGLSDARELLMFGTDRYLADSDGDGLSDGDEILLYGLDALNSDTDGDGINDGYEYLMRDVVRWGYIYTDQLNMPTLYNVTAISAGGAHSLALRSDGSVAAWGHNDYGKCDVPSNLTNAIAVAAGNVHSLVLRSDGTVIAWGNSYYDQCNVPADLTNATAVAAGYYYSLALCSDGTVIAWGNNGYNQCDVPPNLYNATAISAGEGQSLALRQYVLNPTLFDTDADGLGDGWEVQNVLDPFDPVGVNGGDGDPDNDDLTNSGELLAGSDPWNWDVDEDWLPDGWEVQHGLNPLVMKYQTALVPPRTPQRTEAIYITVLHLN